MENMESDEPQFPSVTNINTSPNEEVEKKMDVQEETGDKKVQKPNLENPESRKPDTEKVFHVDDPLKCRSIRIGKLVVHPKAPLSYVPVYLSRDGIAFEVPMVSNPAKFSSVVLTAHDVAGILGDFEENSPIVFLCPQPGFGKSLRKAICMSEDDCCYFDPCSSDQTLSNITLLIDSITEDQERYLRYFFTVKQNVGEICQKGANELLIASTPGQENMESDEPQFPSVTNINTSPNEEVEKKMDVQEETGDKKVQKPNLENPESRKPDTEKVFHVDDPLKCRSIRIGKLVVHPKAPLSYVPVYLSRDGIAFEVPMVSNPAKFSSVVLTAHDVAGILGDFEENSPIVFLCPQPGFGKSLRKAICMSEDDCCYFDPCSSDQTLSNITLLIDSITEDQERYLRYFFTVKQNVGEICQKGANELLIASTPGQENMESDEPQFPSVTNINTSPNEEVEKKMDVQEEIGDKKLQKPNPENPESRKPDTEKVFHVDDPLKCRSIRIGKLVVHPKAPLSYVPVYLSRDGIAFEVPMVSNPAKFSSVVLTAHDVAVILGDFEENSPILFLYPQPGFGKSLRKAICMSEDDCCYFDPCSSDQTLSNITLLIDSITEDQERYLNYFFTVKQNVGEICQKEANELLIASTPGQRSVEHVSVIKFHDGEPIINIVTYPPSPQPGGIPITTRDLACLNEGRFLNDAIIDFYLKYVFYEKLSDYDRAKTHIFSSYFYPRLTSKREPPGKSDQDTMKLKRHSQVKTWTRHVDIFSKDYIIIPVNQYGHWYLAIICFPGQVPDAANAPAKSDAKVSEPAGNVTSTDGQDDSVKTATKENYQMQGESSTNCDSLYEGKKPPDSEELIPEASDSSTRSDGNHGSQRLETPCIFIFDSLSRASRWGTAAILRDYLEVEWKVKKGTTKIFDHNTMQRYIMRCPQQTNLHDCGVYLLQYFENFFQNPNLCFGNPVPDLSNWFTEEVVRNKRQQLMELILSLPKKQLADSDANAKKPKQLEIVPESPVTVQQTDKDDKI